MFHSKIIYNEDTIFIYYSGGNIACSDFLEENSQDLMIPKSVKNYKELLYGEGLNNKVVLCEYLDVMTDDAEEIINTNRPAATSTDTRKFWSYYTWQE